MQRPRELALDTNLLLDLAGEKDWAHDFRERFLEAGYTLLAPPAVVEEMGWLELHGTEREQRLAGAGFDQLEEWEIGFFEMVPAEDEMARRFSRRLIHRGLLPPEEKNDGRILGQTACARIPILVTSDHHLLHLDEAVLRLAFGEAELLPVMPVHPRGLLRVLR